MSKLLLLLLFIMVREDGLSYFKVRWHVFLGDDTRIDACCPEEAPQLLRSTKQ